ncbi:MAG: CPBP family intramembrane metalloprotease [Cyclobacteriaceae bacterium]|nr:CPBP family intramembrane metalloprotease [Cyclobacteriaceae bacterium]
MNTTNPFRLTAATAIGLLISLFGLAFFAIWYRDWYGISISSVLVREGLIFVLVGILLFIIRLEGLGLESVGLKFSSIGKSVGLALLICLISIAGVLLCIVLMQYLGWKVGGEEAGAYKDIPVWALFIMVLRAGIAEELFYRGYAIERIKALTGSQWVAIAVPLLIFSIGHFRQGPGGILISFVAGAILTATYLWKKDLLANMIAHFLVDFIPNVALPLLGVDNS